jgi:hypothetical protein
MAERRPKNVADLGFAIRNTQLIRQNKFAVEFVGSVLNQFDNGFKLNDATLQTESINFPGRNLATVERRSHGVVQEFPYEHQFSGDIEIVFKLLDFGNGITMRTVMEDWMDVIVSRSNSAVEAAQGNNMILQDRSSYTCEMRLFGYAQGDDFLNYSAPAKMTGVATEVFPKTISPMQFSDTADSYQTLTVGFSFREFTQL